MPNRTHIEPSEGTGFSFAELEHHGLWDVMALRMPIGRTLSALQVRENIEAIMERIAAAARRAGRDPKEVTVIAVTKQVEPERIEEALRGGIRDIGENRVQEAQAKVPHITIPCTRHLIGTLQTNKVRRALELFDVIHSVDRPSLVTALSRRLEGREIDLLLQVNVSGESTKHGVAPEQLEELAVAASSAGNLQVRGLMTIAPYDPNPEAARPYFAKLRELSERLRKLNIPRVEMEWLSMGMSNDFEVAVEEGATHVRIGSALFGERS